MDTVEAITNFVNVPTKAFMGVRSRSAITRPMNTTSIEFQKTNPNPSLP